MENAPSFDRDEPGAPAGRMSRGAQLALILLLILTAVLLFSNLGAKYLWQDEAVTAVLGERLMKFGRPLAYDGVNLVTMDHFAAEDTISLDRRTGDPAIAVQYYVERGDFKENTAWIGQPWGQFLAAGVSLSIFGHNTVAARLPFAVAALLTVGLLCWFAGRQFNKPLVGLLAGFMLAANVFWIIHGRQSRYYALSSLLMLLTLIAFTRWQSGRRWGAQVFLIMAWCWFQVDYGSFFPMLGILLMAAVWRSWPHIGRVLVAGLILGVAIAPWVWYYELAGRLKPSGFLWSDRFQLNLFHFNQFLIPVLLLVAAVVLLVVRWRTLDPAVRMILSISQAMLLASLVWVPTVAPYAFHRYIVHLAPLAALCVAWVIDEVAGMIIRRQPREVWRYLVAGLLALFVVSFPLLSNLAGMEAPPQARGIASPGLAFRPEWATLYEEVFAPSPDPNRLTVEALARVASPGDEVLINYEDAPLMFYTEYRIRGGIPCFRVEDSSGRPPGYLVYRRSVPFVHTSVFEREIVRYRWQGMRVDIPDIPWGNNPEPEPRMGIDRSSVPRVIVARNLGPAQPLQTPDPGREE